MARNGSGVFKKFLNAIGIVDEPQEQDQFDNRYASGRSASSSARPSTYVPRQQNSRTADTRRRSVVQDERPSGARYNTTARNTYNNINEGYTVRRTGAELEDEFDSAPSARRAEGTRRTAEPAQAPRTPAPRSASQAPAPVTLAAAPRTVMFNLGSPDECSDVPDALISNNTTLPLSD